MENTYWIKSESNWDSFGVQDHSESPNSSIRRSKLENLKSERIRLNAINPALAKEKLKTFFANIENRKREKYVELAQLCADRPDIASLIQGMQRELSL